MQSRYRLVTRGVDLHNEAQRGASLGNSKSREEYLFRIRMEDDIPVHHQDIVIHNFNIELDQRSVVFHGRFYNQHSGNLCQFQTRFSFSITSHLLKLQTAVMTGGIYMDVARRFLSQPDTPYYDFLK